jgi:hypothetical protein
MYIFVNCKCAVEAAEAAEELSTLGPSDEEADLEWPVDDKQPFVQHMHAPDLTCNACLCALLFSGASESVYLET